MKKNLKNITLFCALLSFFASNSYANLQKCNKEDLKKGYKIMREIDSRNKKHKTQISDVYMEIISKSGSKRTRYFNSWKKSYKNQTKNLIKFYEPANIKNTAMLSFVFEDHKKENEQWFFLPALRSIRQFNSDDQNSSFMGSDFTNSDIAGRSLNKDLHCLKQEDEKYFYITSYPKSKSDPYSKLELKILKKIFLPIQIDFYNHKNKMLKSLTVNKVKKIKDIYLAVDSTMKNKQKNSKTTIKTQKIEIGKEISDNDFGVKNLR